MVDIADSHSSFLYNKQIMTLLQVALFKNIEITQTNISFFSVSNFLDAVETVYIPVSIFFSTNEIIKLEEIRSRCVGLRALIEENPRCKTKKNLIKLRNYIKDLLIGIYEILQKYQYFVRITNKQEKGLNRIRFSDESYGKNKIIGTIE